MRTVKIRMRGADLSREMAAMREWLDRNRYAATRFKYDQHEDTVVVSVDFTGEVAAEAFARRFAGDALRTRATSQRSECRRRKP